jgi:hypothetical protein
MIELNLGPSNNMGHDFMRNEIMNNVSQQIIGGQSKRLDII